jgi:HEAT repeat protein
MTCNVGVTGERQRWGISVILAALCATAGWLVGAERSPVTGDATPGRNFQESRSATAGLTAADRETRRRTAEELGRSNDERNVAPLADALRRDRDFIVRAAAADALGALKSKLAVAALTDALADASPDVRAASALALGRLGEERAIPPLRAALRDAEPVVRSGAAQALGKLGAANAAADVAALLTDAADEVRTSAAEALGSIGGKDAVDALIRRLADKSLYVRSRAALALGKISDVRAVAALIDALRDMDRTVRASSAEALGKLKDRSAVRPLIDALADRDPFVRLNAAYALGKIGDESASDALADALRDEDARVRSRAVDALGALATERGLDSVIDALHDGDAFVRITAVQALGNFSGRTRATEALLQTLSEADVSPRRRALESLGRLGDERALDAVRTALADASPVIRAGAVAAYGRIAKAKATPVLIEALREDDAQVRAAAAAALGQLRSPETALALLQFIGALDAERLAKARNALAGFFTAYGDATGAIVESGLRSEDVTVRRGAALTADVILNVPNATDALAMLLRDPSPELRRLALNGLARRKFPDLTNEAVRILMRDDSSELRAFSAQLLGEFGSSSSSVADALRSALRADASEEVRRRAGVALDRLGMARVVLPNRERVEAVAAASAPPPSVNADVGRATGDAPPPPRVSVGRGRSGNQGRPTAVEPNVVRPPQGSLDATAEAGGSDGRRDRSRAAARPRPTPSMPNTESVARAESPAAAPPRVAKIPARAAAIAENEAATLEFMRAALRAENAYQKKFGLRKFAGLSDLIAQNLIDERYATGEINGYRFALYVSQPAGDGEGSFFILATPIEFDETGRRSFYMDASGLVRIREAREGVRLEQIFGTWRTEGE